MKFLKKQCMYSGIMAMRHTSVRMLEKEMGINQFSIYSSFSNKHNLFVESLKKYREYVNKNVYGDLLKSGARLKDLELFLYRFAEDKKTDKKIQRLPCC